MAYAYLEQYGTPSYYDDEEEDDGNTYVTPSGEPVYFGFYGTYIPPYSHEIDFDWDDFSFEDMMDLSQFSDTVARNNFVDLTQVVFEKDFERRKSQESDYMWLTNPSCDGESFVANFRDGR